MRTQDPGAQVFRRRRTWWMWSLVSAVLVLGACAVVLVALGVSLYEPVVLLVMGVAAAGIVIGIIRDSQSPTELVLHNGTLTIRWRKRRDVVPLSDLTAVEGGVADSPSRRLTLNYGSRSVVVGSNLKGLDRLASQLRVAGRLKPRGKRGTV